MPASSHVAMIDPAAQLTLYVDAYWCSPFDFSCFVALREKQLDFAVSRAVIRSGTGFPPSFRERALVARVPALAHGEFWLSESLAVVEYLEEAFAPPGWPALWPEGLQARARARQIVSFVRSELGALRRERTSWRIFYPDHALAAPLAPLGRDARAEADELIGVTRRLLAGGEVRTWAMASAELAFALLRLARSGETLPDEVSAFVAEVIARPAVRDFLEHSRPPHPPDDGR
jgi:glutathione S-transferase